MSDREDPPSVDGGDHSGQATDPSGDDVRDRTPGQRRRLLVGGGAVALVLVLVVGGLAIARQTDEQSYVGTADGTMPLLGWDDGTFGVLDVRSGTYSGFWRPPGADPDGQHVALQVAGPDFPTPSGASEPVTIDGKPGRVVRGPLDANPGSAPTTVRPNAPFTAVVWEPSPGWVAQLFVPDTRRAPPLDLAEKEALVLRAGASIRAIDPVTFGRAADRPSNPVPASATLVLDERMGRSQILLRSSDGWTTIALEPRPGRANAALLCILPPFDERTQPVGRAVQVRGTDGVVVDLPARSSPDGTTPGRPNASWRVEWTQDEIVYRLVVDQSVSVDEAISIADSMHPPSATEWGRLFVVAEPPMEVGC
jgi:hypothetical protein